MRAHTNRSLAGDRRKTAGRQTFDFSSPADRRTVELRDRRLSVQTERVGSSIIVVTSYALSGDEDKARAAGCDAYVTKPYSPRQLLAKINEYLK